MWTHSETNDHFYKTLSMRYTGQPMTDFKSLVNSTKCLHSYLFLYESPPHSSSHLIPSVSAAIYHQFLLHLYIPYLYCLLTRITIIDSQSSHKCFLMHPSICILPHHTQLQCIQRNGKSPFPDLSL